ncbi:hypothetical protein KJ966_00610 [bacterium]|nr:hypothetical protein [bacterium]
MTPDLKAGQMWCRISVFAFFLFYGFCVLAVEQKSVVIAVPPTPSVLPIIIAGNNTSNVRVTVFHSHSQAHTLFLRADIQLLVTGLSVGRQFFDGSVPVQIVSSFISGMTYLVTSDNSIETFSQLKGKTLCFPFAGSPIEDVTTFFIEREGLNWPDDFRIEYLPFEATLEYLKLGKIQAAILPEPMSTVAEQFEKTHLSLKFKKRWDMLTNSSEGYPQVGVFVFRKWGEQNEGFIKQFNQEIARAIRFIADDRKQAIALYKTHFNLSEKVISTSLDRTDFLLKTSWELKEYVEDYYQMIGKPLDETYNAFFYLYSK